MQIMMLAYNRPHYLKEVLEGIPEEHDIIAYLDGPREGDKEKVEECAELFLARDADLRIRPKNYFTDFNMTLGLLEVFTDDKVDELVVIEDDVLPLKGFFEWMEWGLENLVKKGKAQSVLGYSNPQSRDEPIDEYKRNVWFTPWGWATTRKAWLTYFPSWILLAKQVRSFHKMHNAFVQTHPFVNNSKHIKIVDDQYNLGMGWDHFFNQVYEVHGLYEASPCVPRSINIGVVGAHQKKEMEQTAEKCITSEEFDIVTEFKEHG